MTQAFNLSQLANNLNSTGQLDATDGLVNAVPVANGGTGATTAADARTNLSVPSTTGGGASGTWAINISGNAANGGVTSVNGATGAVSVPVGISQQLFLGSGTFVVPAGVTAVYATVIGGGGGGQGGAIGGFIGGSSTSQTVLVTGLTPGASIPVTVGAGGAGGNSSSNGTTGGTSSFGSYVSVTGGSGGGIIGAASTLTSSYIKQGTPVIGSAGQSGPGDESNIGGGGGGAGWSSGGGGGTGPFNSGFAVGGVAYNGSAGLAGTTASSLNGGAGGAGGSNPGGASGGAGGTGGSGFGNGGGGGGGGAGAVLLRW